MPQTSTNGTSEQPLFRAVITGGVFGVIVAMFVVAAVGFLDYLMSAEIAVLSRHIGISICLVAGGMIGFMAGLASGKTPPKAEFLLCYCLIGVFAVIGRSSTMRPKGGIWDQWIWTFIWAAGTCILICCYRGRFIRHRSRNKQQR